MSELIQAQAFAPNLQGNMADNEIFLTRSKNFVPISTLSSKILRINQAQDEDQIICLYKLGLIMTPGEVISCTSRLKNLTSTRHRNILLRVAHGDIFSNARLARFGLRADAACQNCQNPSESVAHRIKDCVSASEAWGELERAKSAFGL